MKVVLTQDVLKLGKAGDLKTVRDGYGRNYLLPQGLAVIATPGAVRQAEEIRKRAQRQREKMSTEFTVLAGRINETTLTFQAKAGETGKLYGSITTQDVATAIQEQTRYEVKRQQIDMQPIRVLGEHKVHVRLTMDLIPEIKIVVYREGEADPTAKAAEAPAAAETPAAEQA